MTIIYNNFNEGTDGNAIGTETNTDGSSAFDSHPGAVVFDDAQSFEGGMSMLVPSNGASSQDNVRFYSTGALGTTDAVFSASFYVRFSSVAPSNNISLFNARTAADSIVCQIQLNGSGRIIARNSSGEIAASNIAAHAVSANTWYRIDVIVTVNTGSAADGRLQYRIIDVSGGDNDTPITTAFDETVNFGTTVLGRVYYGSANTVTRNIDMWFDTVRVELGNTSFLSGAFISTATYPWGLLDGVGGVTDMEMVLLTA